MFVRAKGCALVGIDAFPVSVEVDVSPGLPQFSTVGLPDATVKESRDRLRAAVKNAGFRFPRSRVTVNLAPADLRKEGAGFDLPMAAAILAAEGFVSPRILDDYLLMGELSLDGSVKGIAGVLSAAFLARQEGCRGIVVARDNAREAAMVDGIAVYDVGSLSDVVSLLQTPESSPPFVPDGTADAGAEEAYPVDFSDVHGQEQAKRAMEIAAAGGHNALLIGPPGSGKTMLAQRMVTILPDLSPDEALETTKIHSVAGLLDGQRGILTRRPFRAPHHTVSDAGLIGGGQYPRPGEISLAHHGILFLDEFPEFRKNVLEALRQPLEAGAVSIARSAMTVAYPARFMLVAAMNPCPCGYYGDARRTCRCTVQQVRQYQARLSGPLVDRIDMHVAVPAVAYRQVVDSRTGESSAAVKGRVLAARSRQDRRFAKGLSRLNARMTDRELKRHCRLDGESSRLLEMAVDRLGLSVRAFSRILKVSRTIADLEGQEQMTASHVAEAISYRTLDRRGGS